MSEILWEIIKTQEFNEIAKLNQLQNFHKFKYFSS